MMFKRTACGAARLALMAVFVARLHPAPAPAQPDIAARKAPTLKIAGLAFKDLNRNGVLDKYEDWRLTAEERASDLISKMTSAEKAGLMIHSSLMGFTGPNGVVLDAPAPPRAGAPAGFRPAERKGVEPLDRPTPAELILKRNVRWILLRPTRSEPAEVSASFANGLQEMAEGSRLGIPIVLSSDPRHSVLRSGPQVEAAGAAPNISQWPEQIGFAAIGDPEVVREFGRDAAQEFRALGLRVILGPMADVVTEPRWNRIAGTFGEDAPLAAQLVKAYIEGFQGPHIGASSVLCVAKHFPGDGPVKQGLDPHNDYGRWQVYPGKNFDHHLIPFKAAFEAGTGAIMPGYAIPVGVDTVGMNFSKVVVTGMLRKKFGFDGLVITDWLRNMPWGVEDLTEKQRQQRMLDAGIDQIGGDNDPRYILELLRDGAISEKRLNESARRILEPMFRMGVFENPYVDPAHAKSVVASPKFIAAGESAQRKSIVLLKNDRGLLPLAVNKKLYVENIDKTIAARYGTVTSDPKQADVAIVSVNAPFEVHRGGASFFRGAHEGSLAYAGAENASELASIQRAAASGTPTVVCMYMDRPAVLTEFIDQVRGVVAHFSSNDAALLDILYGRAMPAGKLPFDLPRDMASVLKQKEDVPHDLENPLFRAGFGLRYGSH